MDLAGKKTWVTIGNYPDILLSEARNIAIEYGQLIAKDINPRDYIEKQKELNMTVGALCREYLIKRAPIVRKKPTSLEDHVRIINNEIIAHIGSVKLSQLNLPLIHRKIIQPKQIDSPASVRRNVITLFSIIRYAIELGYMTSNPITRKTIDDIYEEVERERYLTYDELKIVLNGIYKSALKIQWKIAFTLQLMLLTRKQELLGATWEQVDFDNAILSIPENKSDRPFQIPLPKQAIKLFNILKMVNGDFNYCFAGQSGGQTGRGTLNQALRFSGLLLSEPYTVHDLRRSGATHLSDIGYSSDCIEMALNHAKPGMVRVYQRSVMMEQRQEMLQTWADKIDELINPELSLYEKAIAINY